MHALAVERIATDGVEVLAVEGEIDMASSPRLIAALNEAVTDSEGPLVVDLTRVAFMDSTGLALLLNAHRRVVRRGHGFAVVCAAGPLLRVFQVTDMVDMLRVRPDRKSAASAAVGSSSRLI